MVSYKTLSNLTNKQISQRIAIVRGDLNLPIKDGKVSDFSRFEQLSATIEFILENKGRILLISHFGQPKNENSQDYSLRPIYEAIKQRMKTPISFCQNLKGFNPNFTGIILLENLRFHEGETKNNPDFACSLANLGHYYVNEAFSASHRLHASIDQITNYLPSYAGLAFDKELGILNETFSNPQVPIIGIIGGAKISSKLKVVEKLLNTFDYLIIGGGMANTFLKAQGYSIGQSLFESDMVPTAKKILENHNKKIILPIDVVVEDQGQKIATKNILEVDNLDKIFDIGPKTLHNYAEIISKCKSAFWNGPLGYFEKKPFDQGSIQIGKFLEMYTKDAGLFSLAGGGDTISCLNQGDVKGLSYLSTSGGALLEWIEQGTLPGIEALKRNTINL